MQILIMVFEELFTAPVETLFQNYFLPFILIFAIFWGVLEAIDKFSRKVNLVLALALTLTAVYGGALTWFSTYIIPLSSYAAVIAFALVFIIGVGIWAISRGRDIYYTEMPGKRAEKINKELAKLYKKYREAKDRGDEGKAKSYLQSMRDLEKELEFEVRR